MPIPAPSGPFLRTFLRSALVAALVAAAGVSLAGCKRTVLSGDDPDVLRPTATGDSKRDLMVINIPWMEAPIPRLLLDGKPVVAERVSVGLSETETSYVLRTRTGTTAELLITTTYPAANVMEFTYQIKKMPSGFTLDLPIGLGQVGRRDPIDLVINGAPFKAPPSANVAIVPLARDEKTRIRCTRLPKPSPPPATDPAAEPAGAASPSGSAPAASGLTGS